MIDRLPRRDPAQMVPRRVEGEPGLFAVDATWGSVAPMQLALGVRTVGEFELADHLAAGLLLVDSRLERFHAAGSIPGARSIPHPQAVDRMAELDRDNPTVLFCNGPQCTATPRAIRALLAAGHPRTALLYYRGGMHDWLTLGFPTQT